MARLWNLEAHIRSALAQWEAIWEATGNPAAAWRCFRLARSAGLPVPETVMREFDRIAESFEAEVARVRAYRDDIASRETKPGLTRETVGRLVTRSGRGATDPAAALIEWERDFNLAVAVAILRGRGESEVAAVERVAAGTADLIRDVSFEGQAGRLIPIETPSVSIDVVRRACRRVRRLMPESDGYA